MSLAVLVPLLAAAVMLMRLLTLLPPRHPTNSPPHQLAIGSLAPDFTLTDLNGSTYQLSRLRGKKVLLNFLCGCPKCGQLAPEWERIHHQHPDVVVLGISTLHPDAANAWKRGTGVTFPLLFDPNYTLASQYSTDCPRCWAIDASDTVAFTHHAAADVADITRALHRTVSLLHEEER